MQNIILVAVAVLIVLLVIYYYPRMGMKTGAESKTESEMEQESEGELESNMEDDLELGKRDIPQYSWSEHIAYTAVDPSVHKAHSEFINETSRFSSGANFTSVTDDNTSGIYTNFVGLFGRPSYIPVGATARQVPDIDEEVLMRNKRLRWN